MALSACTSTPNETPYGLQEGYQSYIPTRIAVMNCQFWPAALRFDALPLTNVDSKLVDDLCVKYDQHIIRGFSNQPYMKGFTPKVIDQLLKRAGKSNLMQEISTVWAFKTDDCKRCKNVPSFYNESILSRTAWRQWLNDFSKATRHSDAILFPYVDFMYEKTVNDRGLVIAKRAIGISLLLIDTNNGLLIWSGSQQGVLTNQRLENRETAKKVSYPKWSDVYDRVLNESLWRSFPGRQVF